MKVYENMFTHKNDEELMALYDQYSEWKKTGSLGDNELGEIRDEYYELFGSTAVMMVELDLLKTISERWYKERG